MSGTPGSVGELYQREVGRMFADYPPTPVPLHTAVRDRFRELADWLVAEVPACPELWRGVQELQVSMYLCHGAVSANWRTLLAPRDPLLRPRGYPLP